MVRDLGVSPRTCQTLALLPVLAVKPPHAWPQGQALEQEKPQVCGPEKGAAGPLTWAHRCPVLAAGRSGVWPSGDMRWPQTGEARPHMSPQGKLAA